VAVVFAVVPSTALAWAGEPPLCAVPTQAEALSSEFEDAGMCQVTPHLFRAAVVNACAPLAMSLSGRAPEAQAPEIAARALARARDLEAKGLYEDALLSLRVVESVLPRISDHVALKRASLFEQMGNFAEAAKAYGEATHSINGEVAARAQVARVESLLRAYDVSAERELDLLLKRYPHLPEAPQLKLALADFRAHRGEVKTAIATYRMLDLTLPGYPVARLARERMAEMAAQGQAVGTYTVLERLQRAERLVKSGPVDMAREELDTLTAMTLPRPLALQRDALALALVRSTGDDAEPLPGADLETERARNEARLALALSKKKLSKLRPAQIYVSLEEACRYRAQSVADPLVLELAKRTVSSPPELRFNALTAAAGTASDEALIALADTLVDHRVVGVAARYHKARALERLNRLDEARVELEQVQALDHSVTRFYANFATQRLRAIEGARLCNAPGRSAACNNQRIEQALRALEVELTPDVERAKVHVRAVVLEHGVAFHWLGRALDLLAVNEPQAAADELYEAYLAFRGAARRGGVINAGREAVYRGHGVTRPAPDLVTRRARLELRAEDRLELAGAASSLGDWGTAAYFGGLGWAERHPHPYAREVAKAARKYGLDPDLLFAVMRVESVYQRRIISHAGAIGLMQIMPRTGRLIADAVGRHDATATDLLDPTVNLEFSAWYLSSLLERMDGRLPLAIASYNGGPHNVRKWIRNNGEHMPLDAFLERIPFAETKRYVRRVLGYYAQYKQARGEQMDLIALSLPSDKPGGVGF
jgi:soluble lytic murein transglycosylase